MADSTKLNKDGLNKVWLKVMELIQSLTGNVDRTKGTLQEQIDVKATSEDYGRVKVTNSSAVTDSTGLALAATEKNASIDGTLAKQIDELNSNLDNMFTTVINTQINIEKSKLSTGTEYNSNYQFILEAGGMYLVQVELDCRFTNVRTSIGIAEYSAHYGSNSATDTLGYASNRFVSVIDFTKRTYDTEMYLNYYIHPFSDIGDSTIYLYIIRII